MSFDLIGIWSHMGFLNKLISVILLILGTTCLAVFIERIVSLALAEQKAGRLANMVRDSLQRSSFDQVLVAIESSPKSYMKEMLEVLLVSRQSQSGKLTVAEKARREFDRWEETFSRKIHRGMNFLASTGSISPFVGLLGTVVGIIVAFKTISVSGSGGIASVSGGISEALVETALGLMVAIPAVAMFNYLSGKMESLEEKVSQQGGRILDLLEDADYGNGCRKI